MPRSGAGGTSPVVMFRYKAISLDGKPVDGEMEAADRSEIVARLHDLGYLPFRAEEAGHVQPRAGIRLFSRKSLTGSELELITRELGTLLAAGLPLERALTTLGKLMASPRAASVLARVLTQVRYGAAFAEALEAEPLVFSRFYVGMVRAAEVSGSLDVALTQLADNLQRTMRLRETVLSALAYPSLVLAMAVLATVFLVTYVVPQFAPLFADTGVPMPAQLRFLLGLGDFFYSYGWVVVLGLLAAALLVRWQLADPAFRRVIDGLLLKLPIAGDLIVKVELARLSQTLGTLLQSGVTMVPALAVVRATVWNQVLAGAFDEVLAGIKEGKRLAGALDDAHLIPPLAIQLISVGEESGQLDAMLRRLSEIYQREVERATQRLLGVLTPALTLGLGALVALIISSVFGALLNLNNLAI